MKTWLAGCLQITLAALALVPSVWAGTDVVTTIADSGAGSLRQTVADANPDDTIVFAVDLAGQCIRLTNGTITLSQDVTVDASALPGGILIDGNQQFQVFNVTGGTIELVSLTITNGNAGTNYGDLGGGIFNSATLTLSNCVVVNNAGAFGGGIYNNGATLTMDNCMLAGNVASNSTPSGSYGGGIELVGSGLTMNNSTVVSNSAQYGGGIFGDPESSIDLEDSTITSNSAAGAGGGIESANLTMNNCTVAFNTAAFGGGLVAVLSPLTIVNSTVVYNSATNGNGGGISCMGSRSAVIINSTIAHNSAPSGQGGGIDDLQYPCPVYLTNSIVSLNVGGDFDYPPAAIVNCLTNRTDVNLAALGFYGGPTMTMPPLSGSSAIDAGSDSVTNYLLTDQRGYPRKAGLHVDIGGVEVQFVTVNSNNPPFLMNVLRPPLSGARSFQFTFTNLSEADFTVLSTTNLSQHSADWTVLGNVPEVTPGVYQFTDNSATNCSQQFYRVISP